MKSVSKIIFSLIIFFSVPTFAYAATYYVATNGNDSNAGTIAAPWLTVLKAANTLVAGDTVLVRGGTYQSTARVEPKNSGTTSAWIIYKAYPGEHPEVIVTGYSQGFYIQGKSYIEINGFIVTSTQPCSSGIYSENSHHVRFLNNIARNNGGSGISLDSGSDYGTIEGNIVYGNCWSCQDWQGSGINFHSLKWYDRASGFHNIARNNIVYQNWHNPANTLVSDGNAFIVDYIDPVNSTGDTPPVLIENNIAFDNAGPCINIFDSSNTTIRNNTCYQNMNDSREISSGELNIDGSKNIQAYNNIFVARNGAKVSRQGGSTSLSLDYNINYGSSQYITGSHDINGKDPIFIKASLDPSLANFHLQSGSPAIDNALASQAPTTDYDGITRPQGVGFDIGAYEFVAGGTPTVTPTPTGIPVPGDLNGDGHVNIFDYNMLVAGFGHPYTIFDYNILVAHFGT